MDGERAQAILVALRGVAWQARRGGALLWYAAHPDLSPRGRPATMEEWLADVDAGERERLRRLFARAAEGAVLGAEVRLWGADGRPHCLRLHLHPMDHGGGVLAAGVEGGGDTEEGLRRTVEARDRLISLLAHEMRTPLAGMAAALEVLRPAAAADPLALEAHAVLHDAVRRQARLVDDVLDLGRLAGGLARLRARLVDVGELVGGVAAAFVFASRQRGVELAVTNGPAGVRLDADRDRLEQALANLVDNALRYTPPGGRVEVTWRVRGDAVELAVSDTGAGIDRAELRHLFDLYYRGRAPRHGDVGLGLGLSLVREVARAHGGDARAESAGPGRGATFVIHLPLRTGLAGQSLLEAPPSPARPASPPSPGRVRGPERTVLVVEDDAGLRAMLVAVLARHGWTARTARSAREALRQAVAGPVAAAAVCDLGLADMTGLELLPRLRALPGYAHLPALALTGWGDEAHRHAAQSAGFDRHLVKPADLGEILSWLETVAAAPVPPPGPDRA